MFENFITSLMMSAWGKRLPLIALVVTSLLLFSAMIQTPLNWHSDIKLTKAKSVIEVIPASSQTPDYVKQIPEWHLFGNATKVDDTTVLPVTSLQLRLIGIVQSIPEKYSSVIVSEANQAGKVYLVGDVLPVGVKVNAIIEDGVILENAGRLEKLPLQRQPLSFQGLPKKLLRDE